MEELERRLNDAKLTPEAKKAADRELRRLKKIHPMQAEHTVLRSYLEWLSELPWSVSTEDSLDLDKARQILDAGISLGDIACLISFPREFPYCFLRESPYCVNLLI